MPSVILGSHIVIWLVRRGKNDFSVACFGLTQVKIFFNLRDCYPCILSLFKSLVLRGGLQDSTWVFVRRFFLDVEHFDTCCCRCVPEYIRCWSFMLIFGALLWNTKLSSFYLGVQVLLNFWFPYTKQVLLEFKQVWSRRSFSSFVILASSCWCRHKRCFCGIYGNMVSLSCILVSINVQFSIWSQRDLSCLLSLRVMSILEISFIV